MFAKNFKALLVLVLTSIVLAACGDAASASRRYQHQTQTAEAQKPKPTQTLTPKPTETQVPTATTETPAIYKEQHLKVTVKDWDSSPLIGDCKSIKSLADKVYLELSTEKQPFVFYIKNGKLYAEYPSFKTNYTNGGVLIETQNLDGSKGPSFGFIPCKVNGKTKVAITK